MARKFIDCKVHIRDVKENLPVYFKNDGNRFDYPCTLKMIRNSTFQFVVAYRPLNGSPIKSIQVDGRSVHFSMLSTPCDLMSQVQFTWYCDQYKASRKSDRSLIKVEITFESLYYVEFALQVKYYNPHSCHLNWGRTLNHLQVEATLRDCDVFRYSPFYVFAH